MSTNARQTTALYTAASGVASPPLYSAQQPIYGPDQKYDQQQQQQQQGPGGQQFGGMVAPPGTNQQPQFQYMYPGNPGMNPNFYPPVVVVQQQGPPPMHYYQQPMYGQQFPAPLMLGGLNSGPGLVDCPRCGKRGLTNTSSVTSARTHLWALICCFTIGLGCIPYLMSSLKDVDHHCSSCGALITTWRR